MTPTILTRIGWHLEEYGFAYAAFVLPLTFVGFLIWMGVEDRRHIDAQRAAQQACVLRGEVPAEVYGKIICVAPEALR